VSDHGPSVLVTRFPSSNQRRANRRHHPDHSDVTAAGICRMTAEAKTERRSHIAPPPLYGCVDRHHVPFETHHARAREEGAPRSEELGIAGDSIANGESEARYGRAAVCRLEQRYDCEESIVRCV
jgi:hypothetical protein